MTVVIFAIHLSKLCCIAVHCNYTFNIMYSFRTGSGLEELGKDVEVQSFLYGLSSRQILQNKLIYQPGVLRKVNKNQVARTTLLML